jgi:hypothetical protein
MDISKIAIGIARDIHSDITKNNKPPAEGLQAESDLVIPISYVDGTRGYIEKVVNQINGCYERGWFDGCAVMIRRLLETLIIETFEYNKIDNQIKDPNTGNFYSLDQLIDIALAEQAWNLSRETKRELRNLVKTGNDSAHNRRFNAHRADIDKDIRTLRIVVQDFLGLANLKRRG